MAGTSQTGLTLAQKAGWGLADMGVVVFVVVKQLLVFTYLTSVLGVPVEIAGLATTAVLVFDMITDPLIGYLSDKTHTRWGRRAPWMVVGAVVMCIGMVGLFTVPAGIIGTAALPWVMGFFMLATLGFTMVAIPYSAMTGEMTQNPRERSAMTGWRMGFASLGILVGGALIPGIAAGSNYSVAAMAVVPLIIGAIWLSVFATRNAPKINTPSSVSPARMLALVFSNKAFVMLAVIYGVMTLAIALITAGLPFAAIYLVADTGDTPLSGAAAALSVLSLMFAAFTVGSILSQAVWVWASARLGKLGALVVGLALYIVLLYGLYNVLPSVNVTSVAATFVLAGMANGSYQQIPWAMYPDLMDVTRHETGEAIEGAFSAIWLFGQKAANAFAPLILGGILAVYGWAETTQGVTQQSDVALRALHIAITLVPAGILALSIVLLVGVYRPMGRKALHVTRIK